MKIKMLLLSLLIVGCLSFLLFTESGRNALKVFKNLAGSFVEYAREVWRERPKMNITLSTDVMTVDQEFLINSRLKVKGIYEKFKLNDISVTTPAKKVSLECHLDGRMKFQQGKLLIEGKSSSITYNNISVFSKDGISLSLSIIPETLEIDKVKEDRILLKAATGSIRRTDEKEVVVEFSSQDVEIRNFEGNVKVVGRIIEFSGISGGVKGADFKLE